MKHTLSEAPEKSQLKIFALVRMAIAYGFFKFRINMTDKTIRQKESKSRSQGVQENLQTARQERLLQIMYTY